jgi:type IV secretion system protein VirB4
MGRRTASSRTLAFLCPAPREQRDHRSARLGTFKAFLLDEAWLFIRNETIRNYVVQAQKTWRKHNAAMLLATQSLKELEESGMLHIVSESCPTKIFLANPEMDRDLYREAFHLNDTELELIAGLVPPGQMLIRKAQSSKKVQLNVDSVSHWMATNNARDNLIKREYFARFGIPEGLHRLAQDYPFRPRTTGITTSNPEGVGICGVEADQESM